MPTIKFTNRPDFFLVLRNRVDEYFKQHNKSRLGDFRLFLKTIILVSALVALYTILVFFTPQSVWLSLSLCALLGVVLAGIGFNVMHDGAHGCYSSSSTVNALTGFVLNVMGGNVYLWKQKHNINHHSFTNIEGMDDDIDIKPFIRIHEAQKKYSIHNFQHWYWFILYGTTYLFWVFYQDFNKYFSGYVSEYIEGKKFSFAEHLKFWLSKLFYVTAFIVVPGIMVGWVPMIVGYLVMCFVTGILIAVVFQLAHVVESADFVNPVETDFQIEDEWAIHQINTTVDFATRSKFLNWFLGGLNFQVEHHLFPLISHVHYAELNPIVIQTCKEYNIEYKEYTTMLDALKSHVNHLKRVGKSAA